MTIRPSALLLLAVLASPAAAQPAQPPPVAMRWQMDWGDQFCTLLRMPSDASATIVGIRMIPGTMSAGLRVYRQQSGGLPDRTNRVLLLPSGQSFEVDGEVETLRSGQNVLGLQRLPPAFWEALSGASELQLARGDRVLERFPLTNSAAAVRALRLCASDAMREWGVDEAAFGRLRQLPRSTNHHGLDSVDFPPAALARNAYGRMLIRLTVSVEGRATDCRMVATSGDEALDRAGCPSILRYGRFVPAVDVDGQNVGATYIASILWVPH